ncbi:MAG: polymer-forming cytoskeletal protein [Gemmatimonadales bacterium]|jgi:cytoskeletal protein CcmA (bactofilin family)|nr:MAG: polymer-forming cytoskeletal protein [Gemmatimonadales bacterium]
MARLRERSEAPNGPVISIIGPGMRVEGDCFTEGTLRIEGSVTGTVHAGKAVVVGKEGTVQGDVATQDAVVAGRVTGTLLAASRLEVQATARIEGEVHTRRLQLEDGAVLNGAVRMGEVELGSPGETGHASGIHALPADRMVTEAV